jgi:hypothetical protein
MRTETIRIYKFNELSDTAKENAREWYKQDMDYPWFDESMGSIHAFCGHFNVAIKDWAIGAFSPSWIRTDAENSHFRGVKLRDINPVYMPTGYCLDCTLWHTFHGQFKRTGDALHAFKDALDAAVSEIVDDAEYQYTEEAVADVLINGYEFLEDGTVY